MSDVLPEKLTPYKGLVPYREQDAPFFFGREDEQAIITANLMAARLTVLYGPSGSGKSSVLRAGVEHTLREYVHRNLKEHGAPELAVIVFNNWRDDPVAGLSHAVEETVKQTLTAMGEADCRSSMPNDLVRNLGAWAKCINGELLIILDQFEEYFLYHTQEDGEGTFAVEFPRAVNQASLCVNFLVALREDALSKLDRFKGRIPNLFDNYLRIGHLTREAGRDAIAKPLAEYNRRQPNETDQMTVEPALVDAVLSQVRTGRVTLAREGSGGVEDGSQRAEATIETSYLQLVMTRVWDEERQAESHALQLATLDRLQGAEHIVRTHLDSVMAGLSPEESQIAAEVFRYLVTPSGTKIAYTVTDLAAYTHASNTELTPILEKLSGSGLRVLRTVDPPPDQPRETRYEIFHDVLASAILDWRTRYTQEKEKREIAQSAEAERQRAKEQAQVALKLRRQRGYLIAAVLIALLLGIMAGVFGVQANHQRDEAQRQARLALYRQLAAQALALLDDRFDLALLLATEVQRVENDVEARSSLLSALQHSPFLEAFARGHTSAVTSVAFSPDGKTLVSGSWDGTNILWDVTNPHAPTPLGAPLSGETSGAAFSPDGKILASGSWDNKIVLLDVTDPRAPTQLSAPLTGHTASVWGVSFSPDGKTLASSSADKTIILWDVTNPRAPTRLGTPLTGHTDSVFSVAFSSDGKTLASGSSDKTIILWDVTDPRAPRRLGDPLTGHKGGVWSVAFSPDGKTLASGSSDKTIILWDVTNPKAPRQLGTLLTGHTNVVDSVAFSPDGKTLASGSWDKNVILWDVRDPHALTLLGTALTSDAPSGYGVAFSPDGKTLASGNLDGKIVLQDVTDLRAPTQLAAPLVGHTDKVLSVAFSPDAKTLASAGLDKAIILWNVTDLHAPQLLGKLTGHTDTVWSVAFNSEGKTLASSSADKTIILWDVTNPRAPTQLGAPLAGHTDSVYSVAFSPDGKTLASASQDGTIILWDVTNLHAPTPLGKPLNGYTSAVTSVAFSPDGKTLASGSWDNTIALWDVTNPRAPTRLGDSLTGHTAAVHDVTFSPDGKTLASGSEDNTIILWDMTNPRVPTPLGRALTGHTQGVDSVAFSPDGKTLASGDWGGTTILWDLDPASWQARACQIVGRNFTRAEWAQYFGDEPYHKTCDQWPLEPEDTPVATSSP